MILTRPQDSEQVLVSMELFLLTDFLQITCAQINIYQNTNNKLTNHIYKTCEKLLFFSYTCLRDILELKRRGGISPESLFFPK